MDTYRIVADGDWRRYHPLEVPKGWRMVGTIHSEKHGLTGALGRSSADLYGMFRFGELRGLDQGVVAAALLRDRLLATKRASRPGSPQLPEALRAPPSASARCRSGSPPRRQRT